MDIIGIFNFLASSALPVSSSFEGAITKKVFLLTLAPWDAPIFFKNS